MLSVIIATAESERALVPTLAALVPGAAAGMISEVIVTDAGLRDATAEIAEVAGCRFIASSGPLGARLKAAAATARAPWLMFLRAGCVPDPTWIAAVSRFIDHAGNASPAAAVFRPAPVSDLLRPSLSELVGLVRAAWGGPRAEQGLLIARSTYERIGGHGDGETAEAELLRRLGRRRTAMLSAGSRLILD